MNLFTFFWSTGTSPYQDFLNRKCISAAYGNDEYVRTGSRAHTSPDPHGHPSAPRTPRRSPRSVPIHSLYWQELPLFLFQKSTFWPAHKMTVLASLGPFERLGGGGGGEDIKAVNYSKRQPRTLTLHYIKPNLTQCLWPVALQCTFATKIT